MMCQGVVLEDYDPSRSPVSYDVMYLPFPFIYGAMFGWDVPLRVDPLLLALFLLLQDRLSWMVDRRMSGTAKMVHGT